MLIREQFRELVINTKNILTYMQESKEETQKLKKEIKLLKEMVKKKK